MGEVEDFYCESVGKLDEDFLIKIQKTKDLAGLEKEYLKKLRFLKDKYVHDSYEAAKNQKLKSSLNTSLLDEKNFAKFKSSRVSLDFSESEKKHIEKETKKFEFKRKVRNYFFKKTPSKLIYFYYLVNHKASRYKDSTLDFISNTKVSSIDFISDSFSNIQDFFKKSSKFIYSKFILAYSYVKGKISLMIKPKAKNEESTGNSGSTEQKTSAPEASSPSESSEQESTEKPASKESN